MSTKLSVLLDRMNRYQSIFASEDQYKVRDLDTAIRKIKRKTKLPWMIKQTNLKIFAGIEVYPIPSDQDDIAFIDDKNKDKIEKPAFQYTSIKQFSEDPNNRNLYAEIWDAEQKFIGVKYKDSGLASVLIDDCGDLTKYTAEGDITSISLNKITYIDTRQSIKFNVINSTGVSSLTIAQNKIVDPEYESKWFFAWVYLRSIPTSILMEFGTDSSNYLYSTVTTQFSGQAFKLDDWNLIGFDLNEATSTGPIDSNDFSYSKLTFNGLETGVNFLGATYLKSWMQLEYQYYSKYLIKSNLGVYKEAFYDYETGSFATDDELIGEDYFSDIITNEAILFHLNDKENQALMGLITQEIIECWDALSGKYPELTPDIITDGYNFIS
jgi:hypothetical protein